MFFSRFMVGAGALMLLAVLIEIFVKRHQDRAWDGEEQEESSPTPTAGGAVEAAPAVADEQEPP